MQKPSVKRIVSLLRSRLQEITLDATIHSAQQAIDQKGSTANSQDLAELEEAVNKAKTLKNESSLTSIKSTQERLAQALEKFLSAEPSQQEKQQDDVVDAEFQEVDKN